MALQKYFCNTALGTWHFPRNYAMELSCLCSELTHHTVEKLGKNQVNQSVWITQIIQSSSSCHIYQTLHKTWQPFLFRVSDLSVNEVWTLPHSGWAACHSKGDRQDILTCHSKNSKGVNDSWVPFSWVLVLCMLVDRLTAMAYWDTWNVVKPSFLLLVASVLFLPSQNVCWEKGLLVHLFYLYGYLLALFFPLMLCRYQIVFFF